MAIKKPKNQVNFLGSTEVQKLQVEEPQVQETVEKVPENISSPSSEKKGNRILRSFSCGQCIFGGGVMEGEHHVDCQKRSYRPHVSAAETCEDFKHRLAEYPQSIDTIEKSEYDGLPIRSKTAMDFRTEKQWMAAGFRVKPGEEGYEMHPAFLAKRTCIYYLPEQVY